MKTIREIGSFGEDAASDYLKKRGWHILTRNYRARGGELDIVAYRFGVIACVEVKTRSGLAYGTPAEAVDSQKIRHLKNAFYDFLQLAVHSGRVEVLYPFGLTLRRRVFRRRIDIIEIYLEKQTVTKINHLKDVERL